MGPVGNTASGPDVLGGGVMSPVDASRTTVNASSTLQ